MDKCDENKQQLNHRSVCLTPSSIITASPDVARAINTKRPIVK
jgi:hypothetical protein